MDTATPERKPTYGTTIEGPVNVLRTDVRVVLLVKPTAEVAVEVVVGKLSVMLVTCAETTPISRSTDRMKDAIVVADVLAK